MEVDQLPEIKLADFKNYKATQYKVKIETKVIEDKVKDIAKNNKNFTDKKDNEKAEIGNQVTFDYEATIDGNKFEGSEGKEFNWN